MDHLLSNGALGIFVDDMDSYHYGNRPNGIYIPRFRNLDENDDTDFIRGYGYQGSAMRLNWSARFNQRGFGADLKNNLRKPSPMNVFSLEGFLECLPRESNCVTLDPTKLDRFGIPQVAIEFDWSDNERKMMADMQTQAERLMKAAGAVYIVANVPKELGGEAPIGGMGIHEMGTARMGNDPKTSVLNKHNQAHDVPNLFVTDGSFMTSSSCVNPSLTYMAFTARACDYAVKQLEAGKI